MANRQIKPQQNKKHDPSRALRQKKLSTQLRRLYDDVTQETVPDDFMKLLEDADDAEEDE